MATDSQSVDMNALWQSLQGKIFRLIPEVRFIARQDRGVDWWLLEETNGEDFYRIDTTTYQLLQSMDGRHTVEHVWQSIDAVGKPGKELCQLLVQLLNLGILQSAELAGWSIAAAGADKKTKKPFNPVGFVLCSFNPTFLLQPLQAIVPVIFSRAFFVIWLGLMVVGLGVLAENFTEITPYLASRFDDPVYLFWLWALYPPVKFIHEMAHGLAVMRWGGEVKKAGVMLLVLMPVPFVDASSSSRFSCKYQRMLVAAAGIMVELFLAVIGLLLWSFSETPLIRELGLILALIGSISTLIFNANPLLRFDGYYFLSDWIEIPNLATRSQAFIKYLLGRALFRLNSLQQPVYLASERKWLFGYGILAFFYRLFIVFTIALLVSDYLLWLGLVIAIWALWLQLLVPGYKLIKEYYVTAVAETKKAYFYGCVAVSVSLLSLILLFPLNGSLVAEGVVVMDTSAYLRTDAAGFVTEVYHTNGDFVSLGEPLILLENDQLVADRAALVAEIVATQVHRASLLIADSDKASLLETKLNELSVQLNELDNQVDSLTVRAKRAGVLSIDALQDYPGRFIEKGEQLGYVYMLDRVEVKTVLSPKQAQLLSQKEVSAEIRFYSNPERSILVKDIVAVPKAVDQLPDSILGSKMGGNILVNAQDESGKKTLLPMFQFNLMLPISTEEFYIGKTVSIKFEHAPQSLLSYMLEKGWDIWHARRIY